MTKKELLENEWFAALPMDVELVFHTDTKLEGDVPVGFDDLAITKQANGKMALVIDALPRTYLQRRGMFIMPD